MLRYSDGMQWVFYPLSEAQWQQHRDLEVDDNDSKMDPEKSLRSLKLHAHVQPSSTIQIYISCLQFQGGRLNYHHHFSIWPNVRYGHTAGYELWF